MTTWILALVLLMSPAPAEAGRAADGTRVRAADEAPILRVAARPRDRGKRRRRRQPPRRPAPAPAPNPDPAAAAEPDVPLTAGASDDEVGADEALSDDATTTVDEAAPSEPAPASADRADVPAAGEGEGGVPPRDGDPAEAVARLRARYDKLRDAIFRSRARRETLEKALFSTKLDTILYWDANRNYKLEQAEIRLDGRRLWQAGERPVGDEPVTLAQQSVPPGSHVLAVRIEVRARDNPELGYVSAQSFSFSLPEGKTTRLAITVDEDGDLPSYNPDIEIEIDD